MKTKVSMGNLEVEFIDGHLIRFDKTNLSVQEPYKIIVSNKKNTLILYFMIMKIKYIYPVIMRLYL